MAISNFEELSTVLEQVENCYRIEDLARVFGEEQFQVFNRWFAGQTGAMSSTGELLVFPWDVERFFSYIAGRVVLWD